jgi:hypothetical protein
MNLAMKFATKFATKFPTKFAIKFDSLPPQSARDEVSSRRRTRDARWRQKARAKTPCRRESDLPPPEPPRKLIATKSVWLRSNG